MESGDSDPTEERAEPGDGATAIGGEPAAEAGDQATSAGGGSVTAVTVPARPATLGVTELPQGTLIGRYVVLGAIGSGGMGVVVKAFDPELDRQVAVKVIRPDDARPGAAQRLLREAQALAKLAHPNVVPVFDVGEFRSGVFVAMELIEGLSVSRWLRQQQPGRREILSVFAAAGRGLEAAHRAGLVHRDFKPSNVVVGDDGRVRVLDFGLAFVPDRQPLDDDSTESVDSPSSDSLLETPITRAGAVLGTPGYMSPEQARGQPVDARSDQYSYCAALYRALCGKLPFAGGAEQLPGRADSRLPGWLYRILARGLQRDPAARYPSMSELLTALVRGEGRRRRVLFGVALVAAAAAVTGVGWRLRHDGSPPICVAGAGEVAAVWSPSARERVAAAFEASGRGFAVDSWQRVSRMLDGFAASWAAARDDACRATRVLGTQSDALLDRRMMCLDRRLVELRTTVELLEHAGPEEVDHALDLAAGLTPVDRCADRALLLRDVALVENPTLRDQVAEVSSQLDRARVWRLAGRIADAEALAERALAQAEKLGYPPLLGEALYRLGDCQLEAKGFAAARDTVQRAYFTAVAAGDDATAAWSAMRMLYLLAYGGGDQAVTDLWASIATAYQDRVPEPPVYRSRLEQNLSMAASNRGDDGAALHHMEEALRIIQSQPDPLPTDVSDQHSHLASLYTYAGRFQEALDHNSRAIEIAENFAGKDHVLVGKYLVNQVDPLLALGRNQDALAAARRSLAILESALGPDHVFVALALIRVARSLGAIGKPAEGLKMARRAIAIYRRDPGPHEANLAGALFTAADLDRDSELVGWLDQVAELAGRERETSEVWAENRLFDAARTAAARGQCPAAERWLDGLHTRLAGRDGWDDLLSMSLAVAGECRLAAGDVDRALALAAQATEHQRRATEVDSTYLPQLQLDLADRLWRREPRRARALARAGLDYLSHYDHPPARQLSSTISSWLDHHGGRSR